MSVVAAAFLLGFLGSAHCIGMCGPFVMGVSRIGASTRRPAATQLAYFGGKTLTYAVMGAIAGGASAFIIALMGNAQRGLSIGLGLLLILTGALLLFKFRPFPALESRLFRGLGDAMGTLVRRRGVPSVLTLGMLNGLLPCGLVYGAVLLSATSGSVVLGALAMAAFGIGTVPALAVVAAGSNWLMRSRWRERFVQAGAVLIVIMGLMTIMRGADMMDRVMRHHLNDDAGEEMVVSPHRHRGH